MKFIKLLVERMLDRKLQNQLFPLKLKEKNTFLGPPAVKHCNNLTKKKNSFEPDLNQRPKDVNYASTVLRSTN